MSETEKDPVLAKRARMVTQVRIGKTVGYGLYGYAVVAFIIGAIFGFPELLVTSIVAAMIVGAILLAPAIVFGYGIKAAIRDERETAARKAEAERSSGSASESGPR